MAHPRKKAVKKYSQIHFFGVDFLNKNKKTISIVSYIVGIVLLLFLTSLLFDMSKEEVTKLKYYEVLEMFENDQIESYTLDL